MPAWAVLTPHFPKKIAPEQQDGSRSQRRRCLPACGALAGMGTESCAVSSAAPKGALEGCTGSQRNVNGFLMRFSTSPLKPAVPEQRLRSGEGIFFFFSLLPGQMQQSKLLAFRASWACLSAASWKRKSTQ